MRSPISKKKPPWGWKLRPQASLRSDNGGFKAMPHERSRSCQMDSMSAAAHVPSPAARRPPAVFAGTCCRPRSSPTRCARPSSASRRGWARWARCSAATPFTPIANAKDGLSLVYLTCAAVSILGVGITHFFVAPARRETFRGCGRAPAATAPLRAALDDGARALHGLE